MIKFFDAIVSGAVGAAGITMLWLLLEQALTGGLRTTEPPQYMSGSDAAFIFVMVLAIIYISARLFYKALSE